MYRSIRFFSQTLFSILFSGLFLVSVVQAQTVETLYAGSACNTKNYDHSSEDNGTWIYQSGDQSLDAGDAGADGEYDLVCPVVRQKAGTTNGAKFYVYADDIIAAGIEITCTMTSRKPKNGALVRSASRTRTGADADSNDQVTLPNTIVPANAWGAYHLTCTTNNGNPRIHSYRITEY